jgi:hypothetical protein
VGGERKKQERVTLRRGEMEKGRNGERRESGKGGK